MTPQEKLKRFWELYRRYAINPNLVIDRNMEYFSLIQTRELALKILRGLGIPSPLYPNMDTIGKIFTEIGV